MEPNTADLSVQTLMRLGIHNIILVSDTKLALGLRVGVISSHFTEDKLFPENSRAIIGLEKDEPPP